MNIVQRQLRTRLAVGRGTRHRAFDTIDGGIQSGNGLCDGERRRWIELLTNIGASVSGTDDVAAGVPRTLTEIAYGSEVIDLADARQIFGVVAAGDTAKHEDDVGVGSRNGNRDEIADESRGENRRVEFSELFQFRIRQLGNDVGIRQREGSSSRTSVTVVTRCGVGEERDGGVTTSRTNLEFVREGTSLIRTRRSNETSETNVEEDESGDTWNLGDFSHHLIDGGVDLAVGRDGVDQNVVERRVDGQLSLNAIGVVVSRRRTVARDDRSVGTRVDGRADTKVALFQDVFDKVSNARNAVLIDDATHVLERVLFARESIIQGIGTRTHVSEETRALTVTYLTVVCRTRWMERGDDGGNDEIRDDGGEDQRDDEFGHTIRCRVIEVVVGIGIGIVGFGFGESRIVMQKRVLA